ncbi:MAG: exodeoxyribonuclease VII small subunit [candidate division Zixibacteria bacterium]|nr:exodeoxyribonuclease VII small subunit [candidate division Zixibacteria bacterium]
MTENDFERSLKRLEELVAKLEQGDLPLEEATKLFREGMKLSSYCSQKLAAVEKEVKKLVAEGEKLHLEKFEFEDD